MKWNVRNTLSSYLSFSLNYRASSCKRFLSTDLWRGINSYITLYPSKLHSTVWMGVLMHVQKTYKNIINKSNTPSGLMFYMDMHETLLSGKISLKTSGQFNHPYSLGLLDSYILNIEEFAQITNDFTNEISF